MSWVRVPDRHPGRCMNYRGGVGPEGQPTTKRCLGYDNHEGKCVFPTDAPPVSAEWGQAGKGFYQSQAPEPWVSPLGDDGPKYT